jgi:hypothetical protein
MGLRLGRIHAPERARRGTRWDEFKSLKLLSLKDTFEKKRDQCERKFPSESSTSATIKSGS